MTGYVYTVHPVTGERITVVPSGKQREDEAEFVVISPGSNLTTLWLKREQIFI